MADEILGNCYELITEIAIADYGTSAQKGEKIFTQETPIGIGIIPDLVIGKSVHQPKILVQVHHTKAESASQKKFWRNIGEYVDGRLALGMNVQIITITFDSGQKRKLSEAALKLMDGFVEVDREPYGPGLISFASLLESHFKRHKLSQEERLAHARNELIKSAQSINEFRQLANNLDVLFAKKSKAGASWFKVYSQHQKSRPPGRIPERKLTTLRRALGRFLPVDDESLLRSLLKSVRTNGIASWPQYFIDVGIAKKTLTGSRFINPCPTGTTIPRKMEGDPQYEVYRMTELFNDNMIIDLWKNIRSTTQSLSQACEAIKSSNDFLLYHKFTTKHFNQLVNSQKLEQAIKDCFVEPDDLLGNKIGLKNPANKNLWLFDYLMTIIKTNSGKQQGYGYTKLAIESGIKIDDKRSELDFALPKMLNRTKLPKDEIIKKISKTISNLINTVGMNWVKLNQSNISSFYLRGIFEDKIYKTSSFDPISYLINKKINKTNRIKRRRTFLSDQKNKGAATCDVITVGDIMIMWQTASSKGDHHKTKELSGRVGMLIVNEEGNTISPTSFKQIVLVIDGTWTHEQISRMQRAGFDRIYYVDEIDTMKTELGL